MNFKRGNDSFQQKVNYTGNGRKSLRISVNSSLKKLRTDYIDILYVHWWDYETSIEEVMNSLHDLVVEGKVLYLVRISPRFVFLSSLTFRRESPIRPHGSYPVRICMLKPTERRHLQSIKDTGVYWTALSSARSSPWRVLLVCRNESSVILMLITNLRRVGAGPMGRLRRRQVSHGRGRGREEAIGRERPSYCRNGNWLGEE